MEPKTEKGRRKQQDILAAAAACFARDGLQGASMADICALAKTSPGALYRYFPSKEAIVQAIAEEEKREVAELIAEIRKLRDPFKELPGLLAYVVRAEVENSNAVLAAEFTAEALRNPAVHALFRETEEALVAALADCLAAAQATHQVDKAVPALQLSQLLLILLEGLTIELAQAPKGEACSLIKGFEKAVRKLLRPPL